MYYVIFKNDDNRFWHVKNHAFATAAEAKRYAASISPTRDPRVLLDYNELVKQMGGNHV
jgi:hypothetical protein